MRHSPEQTYRRISLWRSVSHSFVMEIKPFHPNVTPSGCVGEVCQVNILIDDNPRRARHVPEQTYRRISLRRNVPCSSLCPN